MNNQPRPFLIGMCHLPALPGSPAHAGDMEAVVTHTVQDAITLKEAGFHALMIENFGDVPFTPGCLPPWTVASMAVVADRVRSATGLPLGINALRNDALAALGIAVAVGAEFIRVNVLVGVSATDQGYIEGPAYSLLRERARLGPQVRILADVHVKHAVCVSQRDIGLAAEETAYRGMADALVVSGSTTGRPVDPAKLRKVRQTVPDRMLLVGSGATVETVGDLLGIADGVIVGSCLKPDGDASEPIDGKAARQFISKVRERVS